MPAIEPKPAHQLTSTAAAATIRRMIRSAAPSLRVMAASK
jgi:hypothetical protein